MTTAPQSLPPCPWASVADLIGDGAALRSLLALAGPDTGRRILRQMDSDLLATMAQLTAALAPPDFRAIRAQSHVLISLVGTIGAMQMHAAACRLNEAAHAEDAAATAALAESLAADTPRLAAALRGIGEAQ